MHNNNINYMVEAGVAILFDKPMFMTNDGKLCDVNNTKRYGHKCTHRLVHLDYCLIADKLGGNISQKGNGH